MKFSDVKDRSTRFYKPRPTDKAIRALVNILERNGCVHEEKTCGRPRTARGNTESLRQVFEKDQEFSVRNASGRLNRPTTTVHSVLLLTLKKKPYNIQILPDFHEEDEKQCMQKLLTILKMTV
jgi:hypothetical protein